MFFLLVCCAKLLFFRREIALFVILKLGKMREVVIWADFTNLFGAVFKSANHIHERELNMKNRIWICGYGMLQVS